MTEWQPSAEDLEVVIERWQMEKAERVGAAQTAHDQKEQAAFQSWNAVKNAVQDGLVSPALEAALEARMAELRAAEDSMKAVQAFDAWVEDWQAVTKTMLTLEKALRQAAEPVERRNLRDQREAARVKRRALTRQFQDMARTNPHARAALDYLRTERDSDAE